MAGADPLAPSATIQQPFTTSIPANAPVLNWVPKHSDLVYTFGGAPPVIPRAHR